MTHLKFQEQVATAWYMLPMIVLDEKQAVAQSVAQRRSHCPGPQVTPAPRSRPAVHLQAVRLRAAGFRAVRKSVGRWERDHVGTTMPSCGLVRSVTCVRAPARARAIRFGTKAKANSDTYPGKEIASE